MATTIGVFRLSTSCRTLLEQMPHPKTGGTGLRPATKVCQASSGSWTFHTRVPATTCLQHRDGFDWFAPGIDQSREAGQTESAPLGVGFLLGNPSRKPIGLPPSNSCQFAASIRRPKNGYSKVLGPTDWTEQGCSADLHGNPVPGVGGLCAWCGLQPQSR